MPVEGTAPFNITTPKGRGFLTRGEVLGLRAKEVEGCKVILRHANLSTTTQRYLGKVSDVEALRWIENLHG